MKQTKGAKFLELFNDIDDKYLKEAMNYTMKKKFNFKPVIAAAACAVFALTAIPVVNHFVNTPGVQQTQGEKIGANGNFTVYESGVHSGEIIGTHKIELKLNSVRDDYIDENKKSSRETIQLIGETWTTKYDCTWSKTDYREAMYRYEGMSNGKKIAFGINSVTGKCEYFMFRTSDDIDRTVQLTRDELYAIAYEYFMNGGFTDDPENYQLSEESGNGRGGYWFKFARFVNGIETSEYVMLGLRNSGEFYWFNGNRIGEMKDVDISEINMDKMYGEVEAKLKSIYADAYVGFDKEGAVLTKLTDGSYVFNYGVKANVKNKSGNIIKDTCYLTVTID